MPNSKKNYKIFSAIESMITIFFESLFKNSGSRADENLEKERQAQITEMDMHNSTRQCDFY